MNKLRLRILTKLAQTQPTETPAILGPAPNIAGNVFSSLHVGYNPNTKDLLINFTKTLNEALHAASKGVDNFNKTIEKNMKLSSADPNHKNIGMICDKVLKTFLNGNQEFKEKIDATTIKNWADALISSPEFNALSQINQNSVLYNKIGDLKKDIQDFVRNIKQLNPVTA
jgi:hypothetical protein